MNPCELYVQYSGQSLIPCAKDDAQSFTFPDGSIHYLCTYHHNMIMGNVDPNVLENPQINY